MLEPADGGGEFSRDLEDVVDIGVSAAFRDLALSHSFSDCRELSRGRAFDDEVHQAVMRLVDYAPYLTAVVVAESAGVHHVLFHVTSNQPAAGREFCHSLRRREILGAIGDHQIPAGREEPARVFLLEVRIRLASIPEARRRQNLIRSFALDGDPPDGVANTPLPLETIESPIVPAKVEDDEPRLPYWVFPTPLRNSPSSVRFAVAK
jgi:hypothetical protein